MAKLESSFKNMALSLFLISGFASLALAGVYMVTYEPIALAQKAKKEKAIREVIPEFTALVTDTIKAADGDQDLLVNYGYQDSILVGTAVETYSTKGYSGMIQLMVGFLPDGSIHKIEVLQQKETPGLGTKMTMPEFKEQFYGKNPDSFRMKVKKDGGEVDAITAATISSRAFCDAVLRATNTLKNQGGPNQ
jgi:electron transport complex protein RnfG